MNRRLFGWRFGYLLVALLLLLAFHPFFVGSPWEPYILDVFLSLVTISSVFAVPQPTTSRILVVAICAQPLEKVKISYR